MSGSDAVDELRQLYQKIDLAGKIVLPESSEGVFGKEFFEQSSSSSKGFDQALQLLDRVNKKNAVIK